MPSRITGRRLFWWESSSEDPIGALRFFQVSNVSLPKLNFAHLFGGEKQKHDEQRRAARRDARLQAIEFPK
jgi:hypothetical protein